MNEENPKTKIFHNHAFYEIKNESEINIKNRIEKFANENIIKSANIKWGEKQFNGKEWLWINENMCLNYHEENGLIKIEKYIAEEIDYKKMK